MANPTTIPPIFHAQKLSEIASVLTKTVPCQATENTIITRYSVIHIFEDNFYTVEYGTEGESFQPTVIPSGGTFVLLNEKLFLITL